MYSNSKVNFNVFLDFSLDADSVMKAFDEGLWAKWQTVTPVTIGSSWVSVYRINEAFFISTTKATVFEEKRHQTF